MGQHRQRATMSDAAVPRTSNVSTLHLKASSVGVLGCGDPCCAVMPTSAAAAAVSPPSSAQVGCLGMFQCGSVLGVGPLFTAASWWWRHGRW